MPAPRILPLGFIDRTTSDGAVILLTKPSDSSNLRPETAVTLTGVFPALATERHFLKVVPPRAGIDPRNPA